MKDTATVAYKFVEAIPKKLEEMTVYVSIEYATAVHKCCCGCGQEVATPFAPNDWKLTYDGVSVSLWPSIGNWSFDCQSHYWITNNAVKWAGRWSPEQITAGRNADRNAKAVQFTMLKVPPNKTGNAKRESLWSRLWNLVTFD